MSAPPHQRPVSLAVVAAQAGVSMATVSRIVNGQTGRASEATVARVRQAVRDLGYAPNSVGQALQRRASRIVAMLAPNLDNPAMAVIAASTEAALRDAGYVMILCDTHDRADLQDGYLAAMSAQLVQGYILLGAVASPGLADITRRGQPVIFVNRRNPHAGSGDVPPGGGAPPGGDALVGIDNRAAGADAAQHFLDRGITRPAVIHSALTSSAIADRVAGFLDRLQAAGIAPSAIGRATAPGLAHLELGYQAARHLVADRGWPEALLCVSDLMAYGAQRLALEAGLRVPRDCLILGIDENPLNAWLAPWLSSVHIPYADFGREIVAQLQVIWGGGMARDRLLQHRLVVRPVADG